MIADPLITKARELLSGFPHVDAVFLDEHEPRILAIVREHGLVDRGRLLQVEEQLSALFGPVEIAVREHRGRGLERWCVLRRVL
jgi:hypothetical protein